VEAQVSAGGPAAEILRLAREGPCDLIVMGTHGRSGLGRVLMGSVADEVVRKAPRPVLTVKMPPAGAPSAARSAPAQVGQATGALRSDAQDQEVPAVRSRPPLCGAGP
jgi:hypothetical protein